jgi:hypothetical protein
VGPQCERQGDDDMRGRGHNAKKEEREVWDHNARGGGTTPRGVRDHDAKRGTTT